MPLWAIQSGEFEELNGAAHRILLEDTDRPLP
ncbi:MAG TPA: cbb3-type cytochrome oxidase assembly protein [Kiloniellaceae bacterium]